MKKSKILTLVMIVTLLVSCFVGCGDDKGDTNKDKNDSTSSTTKEDKNGEGSEDLKYQEEHNDSGLSNVAVGEYIKFGKYEQDNDESNGKEDIEWLVLDKQDDRVLVVSKYALDCKPYHEKYVTWEECTLRTWLNNDFINAAFSKDEKAKIPTVTVVNDDNQEYDTEGGNDTQDKVFLLSIDEVNKYFDSDEERMCGTTDYAKAQGADTNDEYMASGKATCWWWLRSPGYHPYFAAYVVVHGLVDVSGIYVDRDYFAVRPALWVNLES